jgi:acetolactate synthase-1/3 small subunit
VLDIINVFRGRIVDINSDSLIVEITGTEEKIDGLLEVLRPYGVLEMVRTGIVAMLRGSQGIREQQTNTSAYIDADESGVSYSV